MSGYGDDGFFNSGGYDQQQYGGYGDQQPQGTYGGAGSGGYTSNSYDSQGYNQQYASSPPSIMTPQYNYPDPQSTGASGASGNGGYASFEDEPPLLEGKKSLRRLLIFILVLQALFLRWKNVIENNSYFISGLE